MPKKEELAKLLTLREAFPPKYAPSQGKLDAAALGAAAIPGVGDLAGLLADASSMRKDPSWGGALAMALGAIPFVPSRSAIRGVNKIRELRTGSEPLAELFTSDPDGLANLANTLDMDVSPRLANEMREQVKKETQEHLADYPDVITLYRGGSVTGDVVPMTTNRKVAERFAARGDGKLITKKVKKEDILASVDAINKNAGQFAESEFLVDASKLK